jgi:hypothetical protein
VINPAAGTGRQRRARTGNAAPDFVEHINNWYHPSNIVLSVAGNVTHDQWSGARSSCSQRCRRTDSRQWRLHPDIAGPQVLATAARSTSAASTLAPPPLAAMTRTGSRSE